MFFAHFSDRTHLQSAQIREESDHSINFAKKEEQILLRQNQ